MLLWWLSLWEIAKREVQGWAERPLEWITGIVLPLFWVTLVALMFGTGLMQRLPVALVNLDAGPSARETVAAFDAIPSISLVSYPSSGAADGALKAGSVYASIVIPTNFSREAAAARGEPVRISINKSYYAIGTILEVDLKLAVAELKRAHAARAITKLRQGTLDANARNLRIEEPDVYFEGNTAFNFNRYLLATLVPGLLVLGLAITLAGVLVREWRDGGVRELLAQARYAPSAAILGKALPWVALYSLLISAWVAWFAGLEGWLSAGSIALWLVAGVTLMGATAAVVMLVASLSLTWVLALTGVVAIFAPTFPFTAFSYPFESMTPGAAFFGKLLPLTHYLAIQGECMALGSPVDHVLTNIGKLALFILIAGTAGLSILSWRMHRWAAQESAVAAGAPLAEAQIRHKTAGWGWWQVFAAASKKYAFSRDTLVVALVAVAFYLVFYAWPYSNQQIEHIPTAVLDLDHSSASRNFINALDASPTVDITAIVQNSAEAWDLYQRERASVVVTIPHDFERSLARGENSSIHVRASGAFPVKGRAVQSAISGVITDAERKLDAAEVYLANTPPALLAQQSRLAMPDLEIFYRFNEIGGYGNYTVPVVAPVILQAIMLMLITFSVGAWLETPATAPFIKEVLRWPVRRGSALLTSFWALALLWFGYMQGFDFWFNEYGSMGNAFGVLAAGALYALDVCAFSLFVALLIGTNRYSTQGIVMVSAPAVFISGAIWPASNIEHPFVAGFAHLLPSTPGIRAIVALSQDGAALGTVAPMLLELALQALIYLLLAGLWARYRAKCTQTPD